jgi:hypothetical protein
MEPMGGKLLPHVDGKFLGRYVSFTGVHTLPPHSLYPCAGISQTLEREYLSHYRRLSFYLEALRPDAWVKPTRGVHARVLLSIEQSTLDHRLEQ